jgi:UDP-galactopyranose mutase
MVIKRCLQTYLNHVNIVTALNTPFHKDMESKYHHIFNSMPIDVYYDYQFGELPYRSLKFHNVDSTYGSNITDSSC